MPRQALVRFCLLITGVLAPLTPNAAETFPRPKQLEPAIEFWTRVYTEVDTRGGFIHDSEHLDIVYETVRDTPSSSARRRQVRSSVARYRDILNKLGSGAREDLNAEERRVLELFPDGTSNGEFREAAGRLRFQLGQADRFRAGLIRSGIWRDYINEVLDEHDVPRELVALPHVESSFDPTAYSKAGAAGMWQFTRSTGLRYMRIDHIVDERRDPFFSTGAAARLLRDNYDVLEHWPLAITAYNHGVGGMRRAVRQLGTNDMGVIAERYKGRTFGFASRNFYAAFVAAADVDADPERYFGPLELSEPSAALVTPVPDYIEARSIARALGVEMGLLRALNPALSEMVWSGDKFVPKGFALRVPAAAAAEPQQLLAAVPAHERYTAQQPDVEHRVARGETLSQIASRYSVSLNSLVRINSLRNSHLIRAGQVLKLPVPADATPATLAGAVGGEYVVRRGDTIARIARTLGIEAEQLLRANDIRNRNLIYAGQRLRVPGAGDSVEAEARQAVLADASDGRRLEAVPDIAAAGEAEADPAEQASESPAGAEAGLVAAAEPVPADADAAPSVAAQGGTALAVGPPVPEASAAESARAEQPNALASRQAELAADPSDYSVSNGTVSVQALETLGHYADWLEIRTQRLRDLNGMPFGQAVAIGQSLQLDFSRVTAEEFERRRFTYHQQRQEAFFSSYQISEVEDHVIRRGESLWLLAQRQYDVPVWLLRQYNPDLDFDRVVPGTVVKFPRLRPIGSGEDQVST